MMTSFEDRLLQDTRCLLKDTDRVLLAVSGGADSVAMAHALAGLKQGGHLLCDFVIGHVNHCLRGAESDGDEAFVKALAESLAIPVVTQHADVSAYSTEHRLSIETAGRVLRLKTLAQMAAQNGCDAIVTAHHKDDLAETMVHRLMRGTGFRGLCGILPVSNVYGATFIRPMLGLRRAEIIQYCNDSSIQWREDVSNQNTTFTRNRIRHQLLPALVNRVGMAHPARVIECLSDLSKTAQRFSLQTENQVQKIFNEAVLDNQPNRITLQKSCVISSSPWVFYEVVRKVLVMLDVGLRNYTQEHFEAIRALMNQKQANISMPGHIQVYTEKGILGFYNDTGSSYSLPEPVKLKIGQTIQFGQWKVTSKLLNSDEVDAEQFFKTKDAYVEWFDADQISGSIEIRCRRDGDRFWPIGASGEKKVARFLIDAQLEAATKQQVFIVNDTEKILWLSPVRMSENAKLTSKSREIIEIKAQQIKL